jgi:proteasome component ECM29
MKSLWNGLTGGGAEGRLAISQHLLSTVDILIDEASSKLWRARVGAVSALGEIIVGREWSDLGGGGPILSDEDLYAGIAPSAAVRLLNLWKVTTRAMDDVRPVVRESGESLARAVSALTTRLCDPTIEQKSSGEKRNREELANHERDASIAAATTLWWLIRHGLHENCPEASGVCISTLVGIVEVVKPKIIEKSLPDLIRSLLLAMSGLEPAAFNYVQLRARVDQQEDLERLRLQLAQEGPLAKAVTKCLDLIPSTSLETKQRVASELDTALRQAAGFASRSATADAVSALCNSCPKVFQFPGSSNLNPSVRLIRALFFASERERGAAAKDKMIHALGNLAVHCPAVSVRNLAIRACDSYRQATGNNYDYNSRRAAAATLRTIAVRATEHFGDGGSSDVWCNRVLPTAYAGRKDTDSKIAALWNEVWEEGGLAVKFESNKGSFGTRIEERLLFPLVNECVSALQDVSWSRRVAGANALSDLSDIGVLSPAPRSTGTSATGDSSDVQRARKRAEATNLVLRECTRLLIKPRLWTGKAEVVKTTVKIASKWVSAIVSNQNLVLTLGYQAGGLCPWRPLAIDASMSSDDLFDGDGWFAKEGLSDDMSPEDQAETPFADKDDEVAEDRDKINFEECDKALGERAESPDAVEPEISGRVDVVTFNGLCRFLYEQGNPLVGKNTSTSSEELLPYRAASFSGLRDLLHSLPSNNTTHRVPIFELIAPSLLHFFDKSAGKEIDKLLPPVLVAGAIDCLGACVWKDIGSSNDSTIPNSDPKQLVSILNEAGGKMQPAWTVREAAAQCIADIALKCSLESIRQHVVLTQMVEFARHALTDRKFWRVRYAYKSLIAMVHMIKMYSKFLALTRSFLFSVQSCRSQNFGKSKQPSGDKSQPIESRAAPAVGCSLAAKGSHSQIASIQFKRL